jgi:hypothetical protein
MFNLVVPPGWMVLDLDPATSRRSIASLVANRLQGDVVASARKAVVRDIERVVALARQGGAIVCALFVAHADGVVVGASAVGTLVAADASLRRDGAVDVRTLHERLTAADRRFPAVDARIVELPAGRAVRLHLRPAVTAADGTARADNVQYHLPTPSGDAIAVLSCSTSSLDLVPAFGPLFDAIARSIDWDRDEAVERPRRRADGRCLQVDLDVPRSLHRLDLALDPESDRSLVERGVDAHLTRNGAAADGADRDRFVSRAIALSSAAREHGAVAAALGSEARDGRPAAETYVTVYCEAAEHAARGDDERSPERYAGCSLADPAGDRSAVVAVRHVRLPLPGVDARLAMWCWTPQLDAGAELDALCDEVVAGVTVRDR